MYEYFNTFPVIQYANTLIRDLSRRVVLAPHIRAMPTAFYPYDLNNDMRSDVLAYTYYGDANADWLPYLTNGIVDPYYGWYLNEDEFNAFMVIKYGSVEVATQMVSEWVTNWPDDDVNVTPNYYNTLPDLLQKYYIPIWGARNQIRAYARRPEDWFTNINELLSIEVADTSQFVANTMVEAIHLEAVVGRAEVMAVSNTTIEIVNTFDDWNVADGIQNRGISSTIQTMISITSLQINIPLNERVFWVPLYYYDVERELNESRKSLLLVDASLLNNSMDALTTTLNE